jgi:septum formation protein
MAKSQPFRLILASGSLGRRELLKQGGYAFEILPADIDEPDGERFTDARTMVQHIAWLKAAAVVPHVNEGIVLTADTVGWINGQAIGKPSDEANARRILRLLGGTEHELWTGVCLWKRPGNMQLAWQEMTRVAFKRFTDSELDGYLRTRQWEGCSGAYAIQERDDPYVRVVEGSHSNVVGLPMESLQIALKQAAEL